MSHETVRILVTYSVDITFDPDKITPEVIETYSHGTSGCVHARDEMFVDLAMEKIEGQFDGENHPELGELSELGIRLGYVKYIDHDME